MLDKLRKEVSKNCSGKFLKGLQKISTLKKANYIVKPDKLDGDAPKQFIKAYFYKRNSSIRKSKTTSWKSYIAKTAEKWYPVESVVEFMINRIGEELGLKMNNIKLVKANSQIRFMSEYFLKKDEQLVHGAEICGQHLGDLLMAKEIAKNKITSRQLFTFEFIRDAIRNIFPKNFEPITKDLIKLIVFDAIVGNNDRHFYNWGIVQTKRKGKILPTFAPIYDTARGLLWNTTDFECKNLLSQHKNNSKKIINYINKACPRISIESNTQANHFELVDFLKRFNNDFHKLIEELISKEQEIKVIKMLRSEFFDLFIEERITLVEIILKERFKKLRIILND